MIPTEVPELFSAKSQLGSVSNGEVVVSNR